MDPICGILPNLRDLFQDLNGNIICNRYLEYCLRLEGYTLDYLKESANKINNTAGKPVMLNGVLVLLLRLILDCDANLDLGNPGFLFDRYL